MHSFSAVCDCISEREEAPETEPQPSSSAQNAGSRAQPPRVETPPLVGPSGPLRQPGGPALPLRHARCPQEGPADPLVGTTGPPVEPARGQPGSQSLGEGASFLDPAAPQGPTGPQSQMVGPPRGQPRSQSQLGRGVTAPAAQPDIVPESEGATYAGSTRESKHLFLQPPHVSRRAQSGLENVVNHCCGHCGTTPPPHPCQERILLKPPHWCDGLESSFN